MDVVASSSTALLVCLAIGFSSLALPLFALQAGFGASRVALYVALAGIVQIVARTTLGFVLRWVSDRTIVAVAGIGMAASFATAAASVTEVTLALAWGLQGLSRACFWTGGQTHVIRGEQSTVASLAVLNFFGSAGQLLGPLLAGVLIELTGNTALLVGIVVSTAALIPTGLMARLPPFAKPEQRTAGRIWSRPGFKPGCWATGVAGAWRGLMDSFVPVVLQGAKYSASTTGALISVANAAAVLGAVIIGRLRPARTAVVYSTSMLAVGVCMGLVGVAARPAELIAVVLALTGLGAGVLQTLGPALAADAVAKHQQGDAIAASGTFRNVGTFGAPLLLAAAASLVPTATALVLAGIVLASPAVASRSLRKEPGHP
jgi:MFS family permease